MAKKTTKKPAKKASKKTKKKAKKATKTVPKKRAKTSKKTGGKKAKAIMKEKADNPQLTQEEIAKKLGSVRSYVSQVLISEEAKHLQEQSEKRMTQKLIPLREKALDLLGEIIGGHGFKIDPLSKELVHFIYNQTVRANAARFLLESFIGAKSEPDPTHIVFETIIDEKGIQQKVEKFYGQDPADGSETERDEDRISTDERGPTG